MKSAAATTIREVLRQHNAYPWAWLYDLQLEYSTANVLRFLCTNVNTPVTWNAETYVPFPVSQGLQQEDSEGNLPQFQVTFSNVRKDLARYVWMAKGFIGLQLKCTSINLRATSPTDGLRSDYEITGCQVTEEGIGLACEVPNFVSLPMPEAAYAALLCGWDYMSEECGYRGSLPTCRFDVVDCEAHGIDEGATGRPVMHPRRFGAWLSLPRQLA